MKINTIKPKILLDFYDMSFNFQTQDQQKTIVIAKLIENFALYGHYNLPLDDNQTKSLIQTLISHLTLLK